MSRALACNWGGWPQTLIQSGDRVGVTATALPTRPAARRQAEAPESGAASRRIQTAQPVKNASGHGRNRGVRFGPVSSRDGFVASRNFAGIGSDQVSFPQPNPGCGPRPRPVYAPIAPPSSKRSKTAGSTPRATGQVHACRPRPIRATGSGSASIRGGYRLRAPAWVSGTLSCSVRVPANKHRSRVGSASLPHQGGNDRRFWPLLPAASEQASIQFGRILLHWIGSAIDQSRDDAGFLFLECSGGYVEPVRRLPHPKIGVRATVDSGSK